MIYYLTKNIYLTLMPYLIFFEFFIPLMFFAFLSNKTMTYFFSEEYSMKLNKILIILIFFLKTK